MMDIQIPSNKYSIGLIGDVYQILTQGFDFMQRISRREVPITNGYGICIPLDQMPTAFRMTTNFQINRIIDIIPNEGENSSSIIFLTSIATRKDLKIGKIDLRDRWLKQIVRSSKL